MYDAFICHSEIEFATVLEIAGGLEAAGYTTWYYERDNVPGESYLIQVGRAIEESRCVVLLVSRNSLASNQVTSEVVRAYEARVAIVPLLLDVTHREVQELHPVWRQALVTSTSLAIPPEGVGAVLPRVMRGLENLGIRPSAQTGPGSPQPDSVRPPAQRSTQPPVQPRARASASDQVQPGRTKRVSRLVWLLPAAVMVAVALGVGLRGRNILRSDARTANVIEALPGSAQDGPVSDTIATAMGEQPRSREASRQPAALAPVSRDMPAAADARVSSGASSTPVLAPADLSILIEDASGQARDLLARALRRAGFSIADPRAADPDLRRDRELLLRGDSAARERTLTALGSRAALVGEASVSDVAQGYGLSAVRAEITVDWIPAGAERTAATFTAAEKATGASREIASRAALEAAVTELVEKMQAEGRRP